MGWLCALGPHRQITTLSWGPNLIFVPLPNIPEVFPQYGGAFSYPQGL